MLGWWGYESWVHRPAADSYETPLVQFRGFLGDFSFGLYFVGPPLFVCLIMTRLASARNLKGLYQWEPPLYIMGGIGIAALYFFMFHKPV